MRTFVYFLTATEIDLFESPELTLLDFCLWDWMKSEVYTRKVDIRDELLCGCPHKETLRSTENDTRSSRTSCKVH